MLLTATCADGPVPVHLTPGLPADRTAAHLALLTGDVTWTGGPLWVGGTPVEAGQPVGSPPLLPGAVLGRRAGPTSPAHGALHAGRHLAVLSGPDAGALVPLPAGCRGRWVATDGSSVRWRAHRAGAWVAGRRLRVQRRVGARHCPWGPPHPVALLRTGDRVQLGGGCAELRGPVRRHRSRPPAGRLAVVGPTLLGALVLAAGTGRWGYLLLALTAPLALLATTPRAPADATRRTAVADLAAVQVAAADPGLRPVHGAVPWSPDGSLAVTGRDADLVAAALALLGLGVPPDRLVVVGDLPGVRDWARWLEPGDRLPGPDDADTVVLAAAGSTGLAAWRAGTAPRHRLVVLGAVPSWCAHGVVDGVLRTPSGTRRLDLLAASEAGLQAAARALAAATGPATGAPPVQVALGGLPGLPASTARAVAAAWSTAGRGVRLALGVTAGDRPFTLDLDADGPHLLVGGTTGAGKSQLLVTLVLTAALTLPPQRLSMLLVDFKGGSGLGALARLPHVLEHLTDLDPGRAARTLAGLGAELRRRERVLAAAGAADLADLAAADAPPRLLVVVDEFRALLDEVPAAHALLARLAAQGRALGVHLVLATQRPGGAVGPDLRANVTARIALRVADATDSTDLIGVQDAALLDRRLPGRALVRLSASAPALIQVAHAGAVPPAPVRRAADPGRWAPPAAPDTLPAWVDAVVAAAGDLPRPDVPWLPELPAVVGPDDLPPGDGLPLALADRPAQLARTAVRWQPESGHLLVVGAPGTGRTTALVAAGTAALAAGWPVHGIGLPADAARQLARHDPGGRLGTLARSDDAPVVARLVELLAAGQRRSAVLLVDDLQTVAEHLADLARGAALDRLVRLWTRPAGVAVAAAGATGPLLLRAAPAFADRLVLALRDPGAHAVLGVPATLAAPAGRPGRAVHLATGEPVVCQVVTPAAAPAGAPPVTHGPAVVRLVGLPRYAPTPPGAAPADLGPGGDDGRPVRADSGPTVLVVGPPGTGRSTALARLAGQAALDSRVIRSVEGPPTTVGRSERVTLVVDDLDEVEATDPVSAALIDDTVRAALQVGAPVRVLASTTLERAVTAARGPTARLVRARRLLVLDPCAPGAADLLGPRGPWLADPASRVPGRAVLRLGRELTALQVYAS